MTLELHNITKVYDDRSPSVPVLHGVNLSVKSGDFVALIGSSGSGKSTLLSIAGLLGSPTAGTVSLDGTAIKQDERSRTIARRQHLAFAFQRPHLMAQLTAGENIELILRMTSTADRRQHVQAVRSALESVGLTERIDHYPSELSGGEQQRVAIARALAVHPKVLLADEPTGSLDDELTKQILGLLADVASRGIAVLLASHDPLAIAAASSTYELTGGVLAEPQSTPKHD